MTTSSRKTVAEIITYTLVFFVLFLGALFTIGDENLYVFVPAVLLGTVLATVLSNRIVLRLSKNTIGAN